METAGDRTDGPAGGQMDGWPFRLWYDDGNCQELWRPIRSRWRNVGDSREGDLDIALRKKQPNRPKLPSFDQCNGPLVKSTYDFCYSSNF